MWCLTDDNASEYKMKTKNSTRTLNGTDRFLQFSLWADETGFIFAGEDRRVRGVGDGREERVSAGVRRLRARLARRAAATDRHRQLPQQLQLLRLLAVLRVILVVDDRRVLFGETKRHLDNNVEYDLKNV